MDRKTLFLAIALLAGVTVILGLLACQGSPGPPGSPGAAGTPGPQGAQGPAGPAGVSPVTPGVGLKVTITKVEIPADRKPVVSFTLTDGKSSPLKLSDLDTYPRFTISYIKEDAATKLTEYVNLVLADVRGAPFTYKGETKQPVLAEVKARPGYDPLPTPAPVFPAPYPALRETGRGSYTYTFTNALPEGFDRNATHVVGGQITRATRAFVSNPVFEFVPAGGEVKMVRRVVATASCNQCHDPLAVHGGSRQDPALCVTCHTSQNIDPESGNTVDFKEMVHKIHRGANLPSVVAGGDYRIVGFGQTVFDFSTVNLPAGHDIRNCTTCHGAPPVGMKAEDYAKLAPNADNWKTSPSRASCGACHNQINWATGKSTIATKRDHPGGPQTNDTQCKSCHVADSGKEFDASVVGAHTIPGRSAQLKGYKVEIVRIINTAPGQYPTVVFTAKDNAGNVVPVSGIETLSFNVKGPTTDYTGPITTESAVRANIKIGTDGNYAYTLTRAIPPDAKDTWAIGIESRRIETIIGNEGASTNVNVDTYNPVVYIPVTDKVAVPRRQVVATESCNVCHKEIAFHGGARKNTAEYCQLCHNPANVDVPSQVPATLGGPFNVPPQSINFKLLIHRLHTGEELTRDFTIYRTRGVFNFNEVRFPGDRTNCAKCHVGASYTLPLPKTAANTVAPREFYSPLGPAAAACLGCHDSKPASAHASTMTSSFGEACATCHGSGKDFDVSKVHRK